MFLKNKEEQKTNTLPTIFPFSANPDLSTDDLSGLKIYEDYLNAAFDNPRINNIVVTGDFGVGKSSLIRSFEKNRCKENNGFLYVSLGDYKKNTLESDEETSKSLGQKATAPPCKKTTEIPVEGISEPTSEKTTETSVEDKNQTPKEKKSENTIDNQQKILERRLLLQIYASFRKKHLPATSFKMIQEESSLLSIIISSFLSFSVLFFFFFNKINGLHAELISRKMISPSDINTVYYNAEHRQLVSHKIFFTFLLIVAPIMVGFCVKRIFPKLSSKSFTIKAYSFEAQCEQDACESYLDQHTTEIVYCLEKIAKKINYTMVIEDLDRVDTSVCIEIFTRLREINNLVNLRLSRKHNPILWRLICHFDHNKSQHLRFVYVTNDSIVSQLKHSKFADYILPVYPKLNIKTAEKILEEKIDDINLELKKTKKLSLQRNDHLVQLISSYLTDYRMQYAVLNDYSLLINLYNTSKDKNASKVKTEENLIKRVQSKFKRIPSKIKLFLSTNKEKSSHEKSIDAPSLNTSTNEVKIEHNILAFAFYKNVFSDDFSQIWTGNSNVFPDFIKDKFTNEKDKDILTKLTDDKEKYLTIKCLFYAGYSEEDIINLYLEKLKNNLEDTLNYPTENKEELREALLLYCKGLSDEISLDTCDTKNGTISIITTACCQKTITVIKYMISNKISDFDWLFCDTIYARTVLEILQHESFSDDELKWIFGTDKVITYGEDTGSVFDKCKKQTVALSQQSSLSDREYEILQMGLNNNFDCQAFVYVGPQKMPIKRTNKE